MERPAIRDISDFETYEEYLQYCVLASAALHRLDNGQISDGFHTFNELYDHRITLWIAVCRMATQSGNLLSYLQQKLDGAGVEMTITGGDAADLRSWRSELHSDGTRLEGWFVLGLYRKAGEQITYHLPMSRWSECDFAETLERAPEFDGHTSADVLQRLKKL